LNGWVSGAPYVVVYQNRLEDSYAVQGAMREYWKVEPQDSSSGGLLYSCVYESYSGTCYQGS
jgi:hypothetical protein